MAWFTDSPWFSGSVDWFLQAYREGLTLSCPVQCMHNEEDGADEPLRAIIVTQTETVVTETVTVRSFH